MFKVPENEILTEISVNVETAKYYTKETVGR